MEPLEKAAGASPRPTAETIIFIKNSELLHLKQLRFYCQRQKTTSRAGGQKGLSYGQKALLQ